VDRLSLRDIDVVNAIHKAFPDVEILVDGNNGFTVETMIGFLKGIADVPLFWIEEPFHETVADWTRLRDYLVANGRNETLRADGNAPTVEGVTTKGGDVNFGENRIIDAQFHPSNQPGFGLSLPS
jgi:hypothetical protein